MLTNEQLAEFIQQGGNDDLKPVLWKRVRRLLYMRSSRYFRQYSDYCAEHSVTEWDLKQQAYPAYENALLNTADSLDRIIDTGDGGGDTALIDLIADDTAASPFDLIEENSQRKENARVLRKCVDSLEDREKTVINGYFYNGETLSSIGNTYGISAARVQQIKDKALRNMSVMPEIQKLRDEYGYTSRPVYHDSLTKFRQHGQSTVEHIAIERAGIELQAAKAMSEANQSWTSDKDFLKMLEAAQRKRNGA